MNLSNLVLPPWAKIALKALPYVAIAVLAGLLYLSNGKVSSLNGQLDAANATIETRTTQRDFFRDAVQQRDVAIQKQNLSIQSLADAAKVNRDAYVAGIKVAQSVSADHQRAASELLALTAPDGELNQCRAARDLLESELVK